MKTHKREWFDNEAFWRKLYPCMFPEKDMAEVDAHMVQALELAQPRGKTVLDLCCGAGRYSIALARRGFSVTAVDKTKYLLDKGRSAARAARVRVKWVRQDMRDFIRPNSFAFVLSMFSSFGYFERKGEDVGVLKNIFASLEPGGVLLMDLRNREPLAAAGESTISNQLPDGSRLVERHGVSRDWVRVRNAWTLKINGKSRTFEFAATVYSSRKLREMLNRVGFQDVKFYGNLQGEDYGVTSQRLVAVTRKPNGKH